MMVFYGGAIQGAKSREEMTPIHKQFIDTIKACGFELFTEHTGEKDLLKIRKILETRLGPLPDNELERRIVVRNKLIEAVEGDIKAAIFEVSLPSLGTGVELTHAYLRPRLGLKPIPVLALYKKDFWPNKLSTMVRGISKEACPDFKLIDYQTIDQAKQEISSFLNQVK